MGGGPAGCTVARAMASWGYRVAVLDADRPARLGVGETIGPEASPVLERLGLGTMLRTAPFSIRSDGVRSRWASDVPDYRDYAFEPSGGWIVDKRRFAAALRDGAIAAGASWLAGRRVHTVRRHRPGFELALQDGRNLSSALLVDASGRVALPSRRLGARRVMHDPLLACELPDEAGAGRSDPSAWIDITATPSGWIYRMPAPGSGGRVLVTDRAGRPALPMVDATVAHLDHIADRGWLAVGDAAFTTDPISSQGMSQALSSGLAAAQALDAWCSGRTAALDDYAEVIGRTRRFAWEQTSAVYRSNRRWSGSGFWARRTSMPAASARDAKTA